MAPASPQAAKSASSGIITDKATGERHIPSSQRADGSTRREIRIRPGYRPPEDVEVYKNRTAEAWKSRGSGGVPGADSPADQGGASASASSAKNAKRREARKRAKAAESDEAGGKDAADERDAERPDTIGSEPAANLECAARETVAPSGESETVEKTEHVKQARKLRKKLREARELQEKKDKGEGLLQEQFEKVIKINELIRDLDKLGFDADGNP